MHSITEKLSCTVMEIYSFKH